MRHIFLADLTHTAHGIAAQTFPLGTASVTSYARAQLGDRLDFRLFKFPQVLSAAIVETPPAVLGLASYSWNFELAYAVACWAKRRDGNLITVFGGPNFPVAGDEKAAFLAARPAMDFFVQNEGELGFVALLEALERHGFDRAALQGEGAALANTCYLRGGTLVEGEITRLQDINDIPSPYLTGLMDEFFDHQILPLFETTRGCPFSCSFCADGLASKNRVTRFAPARIRAELRYIAERVQGMDELCITDLNFGMYKQDLLTADFIAEVKRDFGWPTIIKGSAGKNQPERIIEVASKLGGAWVLGSSIQSADPEVLKNIKRSNISLDAYRQLIDYVNSNGDDSQSYTEVILALPGDTMEKHFQSLRVGIDNRVSTVRMYQAMMLLGTDMASRATRDRFALETRYRVVPGNAGIYEFGGERVTAVELEEIIVATKDLPFEDYLSCRVMNLIVDTYLNNGLFEEILEAVRAMGLSVFDLLEYIHAHPELNPPVIAAIFESYLDATANDLFATRAEAEALVADAARFDAYLAGGGGANELLDHKAMLYEELDAVSGVLTGAVSGLLAGRGMSSPALAEYFEALRAFVLCRKRGLHGLSEPIEENFVFDLGHLAAGQYNKDPREAAKVKRPTRLRFFHEEAQRKYISNAVRLYESHPGRMGRFIHRNNLKMMYRRVASL
jgi:hypothetical protein